MKADEGESGPENNSTVRDGRRKVCCIEGDGSILAHLGGRCGKHGPAGPGASRCQNGDDLWRRQWARGSRRSRGLLLAALVCSSIVLGTSVPMGARDLEHGDVPPTHYNSKNLDLSQPRPVVNGQDGSEDEFEDLSHQKRAPPHPRIRTVPRMAQMKTQQQLEGRNPGDASDSEDMVKTSVWTVAFNTLLMAVASGLGAAPFFIVNKVKRKWLGIANALASGVMLAASFGLIQEGLEGVKQNPGTLPRLMAGMILGLVFIICSQVSALAFCAFLLCRTRALTLCLLPATFAGLATNLHKVVRAWTMWQII